MTAKPADTTPTPDDLDAAIRVAFGALATLHDAVSAYFDNQTAEERRRLPKAGPKTDDFVGKAYQYAQAHPEFLPAFDSVEDFGRHFDRYEKLRPLLQAIQLFVGALSDAVVTNGSRSVTSALGFYGGAQQGAKRKQYGAEEIVADLGTRFPGRPSRGASAARKAAKKASGSDTGA